MSKAISCIFNRDLINLYITFLIINSLRNPINEIRNLIAENIPFTIYDLNSFFI